MIDDVRPPAMGAGLTTPDHFDAGVRDLHATTGPGGVCSGTSFTATAIAAGTVTTPGD